jgi:MFS family permease
MSRHRWLALAILCAATLMTILDGTIVTVALPTIAARLGFAPGDLSWVMNSYLIAFGGLLLLGGRLGDLIGRKRVFLAGIAAFTLASLACGLAAGPGMLIAARFAQGAGAAMASSVTLGMIVRLFARPEEQGKAIGAFAFTGAVGASAGLIIGGLLVQYASWRWIFLVNLPIGAVTWLAGARVVAADRGIGLRAGVDVLGGLLATSGVMLAVFVIAAPADWWAGLIAAALLAAFAARQATARTPLLPPRVLASRVVAGTNVAQLLAIGAAMGFQVIVTLYMQRALGYGPAAAGLGLFPTAAVIAVVSLGLSARLRAAHHARRPPGGQRRLRAGAHQRVPPRVGGGRRPRPRVDRRDGRPAAPPARRGGGGRCRRARRMVVASRRLSAARCHNQHPGAGPGGGR